MYKSWYFLFMPSTVKTYAYIIHKLLTIIRLNISLSTINNLFTIMIDNNYLAQTTQDALVAIENATSIEQLEGLRIEYFGKKGSFSLMMQGLRDVPAEQRPAVGAKINEAKEKVQTALNDRKQFLTDQELNKKLASEKIDVSLPGRSVVLGGLHPVSKTINRVVEFFNEIGFKVVTGPEIESAYYNFSALNIPDHHPARADHDTFWFDAERLLRTQTSGMQIRAMEKLTPPLRIIGPGRVYRNDYDQTDRKSVV